MGRVANKVAIVTGAALGLGAASALMLAKEGATVVLADIRDEEGQALGKRIELTGSEALYVHHDVASEESWQALVERTLSRFGRIDVLVNNAGVAASAAPEEQTLQQWRWLMSINLDGVFLGTKQAIIAMKSYPPKQGGSIINLSSIEGLVGDPQLGAYNASKGGVRLYTKSVALYCAKAGLDIRVNSIHPGYIWTPMVESYLRSQGDGDDMTARRRELAAMHPVGRIGEPDDIAYGVVYLASNESKFVTGAELVIDGGYTAQ
ncbi:MAG TPA: glucose 1-dehydrogenase [Steroidobacteraceae bacterium]|nr:glucose 1-dehydrogenase [Steroidobacteraceae bacterium]